MPPPESTSPSPNSQNLDPRLEVLAVYAAVAGLTFLISGLSFPLLQDYAHLLIAALFLLASVRLAQREPDGLKRYGIDLGGLLDPPSSPSRDPFGIVDLLRSALRAGFGAKETAIALGAAALIFPPFAWAFWMWHEPSRAFTWVIRPDMASFAFAQLLVVALPEEMFFRGYVQTRLLDACRAPSVAQRLLAVFIQAILFAVLHVVAEPHPARLAVFFPGLLFGWLRAWRGGVGAATVMHALSNMYSDILVRGWLLGI